MGVSRQLVPARNNTCAEALRSQREDGGYISRVFPYPEF